MSPSDVRALLEVLSRHRVLPPPRVLPGDSEELRAALAEIVEGPRSRHTALIREVAASHGVSVEEIVRRAAFLLACLVLPAAGSHYELLGVAPTASSREIRKRWATLIQRYHPDRTGPEDGLAEQARRIIEAYQTLRDAGRRRQYDAELLRARVACQVVAPVDAPGSWRRPAPAGRWRWTPAVIAGAGAIVLIARWTLSPLPGDVPRVVARAAPPAMAVPSALAPSRATGPPAEAGARESIAAPPSTPAAPLPSLVSRLAALESAPGAPVSPGTSEPRGSQVSRPAMTGSALDSPPPPAPEVAVPAAPSSDAAIASGRRLDPHEAEPGEGLQSEASAPRKKAPPAPPAAAPPSSTVASLPAPAEPVTPTPERWGALIERFRAAYERKDLDGLMTLLAGDVREQQTRGRGAVQELYATTFRALGGIRYELSEVTAQPPSPDGEIVVHARFRIRALHLANGSRPLDAGGPIRWTIQREGESLRIVQIDYSVTAP